MRFVDYCVCIMPLLKYVFCCSYLFSTSHCAGLLQIALPLVVNKPMKVFRSASMEQPVQPMPLFPNVGFPIANNALRGTGQISWLSSKAGLITCHKPIQATISFQLKDFWDTVS